MKTRAFATAFAIAFAITFAAAVACCASPALRRKLTRLLCAIPLMTLLACSQVSTRSTPPSSAIPAKTRTVSAQNASERGMEIVLFAFSLLDTGYRFGGKNPEAGFDCSGMVSYIYDRAAGLDLRGSAADMALSGKAIEKTELRPGDLVFFNTLNRPLSHVGIYIGDDRFIHAPSSSSRRVRVDELSSPYFKSRYETARTYLD